MEAFFCTDLQATPVQILEWVVMRWSVEVTLRSTAIGVHWGSDYDGHPYMSYQATLEASSSIPPNGLLSGHKTVKRDVLA
jgi:hypothetical protein